MPKTYGEQFKEALACTTKEQGSAWMKQEIQRYYDEFSIGPDEAEKTIKANIGYMAGYYGTKEQQHIRDIFDAVHPIFG